MACERAVVPVELVFTQANHKPVIALGLRELKSTLMAPVAMTIVPDPAGGS